MDSPPRPKPRILFLDAYDSFANNITALLATLLCADVHVLPIDAPLALDAFCAELACYDAVVCGPGPGSPDCPADIGLMKHVWTTTGGHREKVTPALGICLGFQSLVAAHGGRIRRLRSGGLHGMVRPIEVCQSDSQKDIFAGVAAPFRATLYHSLGADIGQDDIADADWPTARWQSPRANPDLVPLAWVEEPLLGSETESEQPVERIVMGVRHRTHPFWGLQYHPESVCTDATSHAVLANWFRAAMQWNAEHGRVRAEPCSSSSSFSSNGLVARQATRPSLLSMQPSVLQREANGYAMDGYGTNGHGANGTNGRNRTAKHISLSHPPPSRFVSRTIPLPSHVEVPDIVEALQAGQVEGSEPEQIILDSASAPWSRTNIESTDADAAETANDEAIRGRFSIFALDVGAALRVEYRTGHRFATIRLPGRKAEAVKVPLHGTQTIWQLLAEFHEARRLSQNAVPSTHSTSSPFLGGFMGYITYEQGLGDIGVPLPDAGVDGGGRGHDRPDVCFAWVTRSVVVDHVLGVVHVQHLEGEGAANGANSVNGNYTNGKSHTNGTNGTNGTNEKVRTSWVDDVVAQLQTSTQWQHSKQKSVTTATSTHTQVVRTQTPDIRAYEDKVRVCQENIAAGDSYELCLTDETRITTLSTKGSPSSSWHYYRTLRKKNPSPFASYVRLGGATLVSSSPERFLCFSPGDNNTGTLCSMRPMKGTVRRSAEVATLAQAEALLHVPKEEAENLMIVDLVRHDLHGVCGPGHVAVPRLLQVEPYGHVFQMVTVVEGILGSGVGDGSLGHTGLDVLAASLPPGSMTGAPKKRSCALLQEIECQPASPRSESRHVAPGERSLYSGVVGYFCVTGRGDWSVTIRSLFRWDDETTFSEEDNGKNVKHDVWHIGAGGAVTILSTPEGERDEMFIKLSGPLGVFDL